jgi:hypothetical protein
MWDEVFPGANINTKLVDSKNLVIVFANLFKNTSIEGLERKLTLEYKIESGDPIIEGSIAPKIVFLLSLLSFKSENVFDIYKKRQQCDVDDSTILEWLDVNSITDDALIKFVDYRPSISAKELMDKGIKGAELGREIKRLETEKFLKTL